MKKLIYLFPILLIACNSNENNSEESKSNTKNDTDSTNTEQVLENTESNKAAYLKSMVGKYPLKFISAAVGANSMLDYYIGEDGNWIAGGSSLEGGEREGYPIELSDEDINKFNTTYIEVKEDLSISIIYKNNLWREMPFEEKAIYRVNPKVEYIPMPDGLTDTTNLMNEWYYIIAQDNMSKELHKSLDMLDISADVLVLKVSANKPIFELNLFYGDCCDNSIYTFSK